MPSLIDTTTAEQSVNQLVVDLASLEPVDFTPAPLPHYEERHLDRAKIIQSVLSNIEETMSVITHLEARVAELRVLLEHRVTSVKNMLVVPLPNELLLEIFRIVADTEPTLEAGIRLSHVSSQWRAVALTVPKLWTNVRFNSCYAHDSDILDEFVRRSGRLEISFSNIPTEPRAAPKALPRGHDYNRVKSISLDGDISLSAFHALARYGCGSLREVSLSVPFEAASISATPSFEWCQELNDIEVLRLCGVKVIRPGAVEYHSDPDWIYDWTPRLKELYIRGVDCRSALATLEEIPCMILQRVSLSKVFSCEDDGSGDVCDRIMNRLESLELEHLEFDKCESGFMTSVLDGWGNLPKSVTIGMGEDDEVGYGGPKLSHYIGDMLYNQAEEVESLCLTGPDRIIMNILRSVAQGSDMDSRGPLNELVPALENLSITVTQWSDANCDDSIKWFKKHLANRVPELESLVINQRLLHDETDTIRSYVNTFTLLDDSGKILPPLPPLPTWFIPSDSGSSEDEDEGEGSEEEEEDEEEAGDDESNDSEADENDDESE